VKSLSAPRSPPLLPLSAVLALATVSPGWACVSGDEKCPIILRMEPGSVSVTAHAVASQDRFATNFQFAARAGQTIVVTERGAVLKDFLSLAGPGVSDPDALHYNTPFKLPGTGVYTFSCVPNMMAGGAFGPFAITLTIK
jgi:hypothetical protein